jgi:16S rRNA (adenine1518-N6/adenine1519-N6)-dimethyltransferase
MTTRYNADRPLAKKRFGQHFLEPVWAEKVIQAIAPSSGHVFLEIGPGPGALTYPLAARAQQLTAFEIDRDLAARLRESDVPNLQIVEGDFLEMTPDRIREVLAPLGTPIPDLRVAGNLPYNVASPIMFKLVELYRAGLPIVDASVMLQREVANRLLAAPGTKDYGVLTVLIRHQASVDRLLQLPAGAFRPAPKVLSSVVRLRFHPADPIVQSSVQFAELTQAVFTRRRKTLTNALLAYPPAAAFPPARLLALAGIDGQRRPETLSLAEFGRLSDLLPFSSDARLSAPPRAML